MGYKVTRNRWKGNSSSLLEKKVLEPKNLILDQGDSANSNAYETLESSILKKQNINENDVFRIIAWGGGNYPPDNNSFHTGASIIKKDYGRSDKISLVPLSSGTNLVKSLNQQSINSIQSLDVVCHGASDELSLYYCDASPSAWCSPTSWDYNLHHKKFKSLKTNNPSAYEKAKAAYEKYIKHRKNDSLTYGLFNLFSSKTDIDTITFQNFKKTAKIEFHGCNTGFVDEKEADGKTTLLRRTTINLCKEFSEFLYDSTESEGNRTVVIGHNTPNSPNSSGDYRHKLRRVYHNGNIIFECRKSGRISKKDIDHFFDLQAAGKLTDKFGYISPTGDYSLRQFDDE